MCIYTTSRTTIYMNIFMYMCIYTYDADIFCMYMYLLDSVCDTTHPTIYRNMCIHMCIYTYDADILCM